MEHFKLEITNRNMRVTIFSGVKEDFAESYHRLLSGNSDSDSDDKHSSSSSPCDYEYIFAVCPEDGKSEKQTMPPEETIKKPRSKQKILSDFIAKYHNYNYAKRNKSRAEVFRNLAYLNFRMDAVKLVTLTFDEKIVNCKDFSVCKEEFKKFIKRLRGKFRNLVYLGVYGKQKNGNLHYHLFMNLPDDVRNKEIETVWGLGRTNISSIYSFSEFSTKIHYCIDNMMKIAWEDLQGEKAYVHGNGMQRPKVFRSWKEDEADQAYDYLSRAVYSPLDKPLQSGNSYTKGDDFTGDEVTITHMISSISIAGLFAEPKVAERIKKAPRK